MHCRLDVDALLRRVDTFLDRTNSCNIYNILELHRGHGITSSQVLSFSRRSRSSCTLLNHVDSLFVLQLQLVPRSPCTSAAWRYGCAQTTSCLPRDGRRDCRLYECIPTKTRFDSLVCLIMSHLSCCRVSHCMSASAIACCFSREGRTSETLLRCKVIVAKRRKKLTEVRLNTPVSVLLA